jgi:hypothetical protein
MYFLNLLNPLIPVAFLCTFQFIVFAHKLPILGTSHSCGCFFFLHFNQALRREEITFG